MLLYVFLVLATLSFTAFFSSIEIAFFSANKFKIELKNSQGEWVGQVLSRFIKNTPRFLTTILIGNNIALVVYGVNAAHILDSAFEGALGWTTQTHAAQLLVGQTVFSTLVVLVLGEYLPKALARRNPDSVLYALANAMHLFDLILRPFVLLAEMFTAFIFRYILRQPIENQGLVFQKVDLQRYIEESIQSDEEGTVDAEVFSNALDFNKIRAREFMVPRTEIVALPIDCTMEELKQTFLETELSRIVIYDDTLDNVKGYVHTVSMFKKPKTIQQALQPLMFVPESMQANLLLSEFNRERKPMAIVLDEFGGTSGLVTVEDLVEVVFGEIEDEHDDETADSLLIREKLAPNLFRFSSRLEIDELNDEFHLGIPDEHDYNTLSGFIMHFAERIPQVGETVFILNFIVTVEQGAQNRIDVVRLEKKAGTVQE